MSASGSAGGDHSEITEKEPPVRRHGTRLVKCRSETGEGRVVVYEPGQEKSWMDAAAVDVSDLSEMR